MSWPRICPEYHVACANAWCLENDSCKCKDENKVTQSAILPDDVLCKHDGKPCDLSVCRDAAECKGLRCPEDDTICGMAACLNKGNCAVQAAKSRGNVLAAAPKNSGGTANVPVTAANSQYVPKPPCHVGFYKVGTYKEMTLWVGKEATFRNHKHAPGSYEPFALVLSLLGPMSFRDATTNVSMNEQARKMLPPDTKLQSDPLAMIAIDWPDYEAPLLSRHWWNEMTEVLKNVKGDVLIYCMGGHGRTGTAASIFGCLLGLIPEDKCPVEWLRGVYCKDVVESEEQLDYIECMTGRAVTAEPHAAYSFYSSDKTDDWWHGGRA